MPTTTVDFNVGTVGAALTGWTQSSGNPFVYRAGTGSAPFTTQGIGSATPANDQWAIYTSIGSTTGSMTAQIDQYMQVSGSSWQGLGIVLCSDSTFTNGYLITWDVSNGTAPIYKKTGGSYVLLGTSGIIGPTRTSGNPATIKADYNAATNTISVKVWDSNGSEPGSYGYSVVDSSSPFTGGYVGFRLGKNDGAALGGTLADTFVYTTPATGPTSCTITGPSAGRPSVASANFTATLDAAATASTVVTPSDGGAGGTFTPSTVTIGIGSTTGTFTYTAASTGAKTITATNNQSLTNVGSLTYTAYSLALAPSSQSVANSIAASLTATLTGGSGTLAATTTAGTLSTSAPTSGTGFTLTTPSSGSGTATVTVNGPGGTTATATVSYAPAAATAITWGSYPTAVPVGSASSAFNFAANGSLASSVSVTVTVTPSGGTITSTPVTLASGVGSAGSFTYTAPSATTYTVSITNNGGLTNPAPLTITATAVSTLNFLFPAGVSGLSSVGFTLVDLATDTQYQAFTTVGVSEPIAGSGVYVVNVSLPKTLHVACLWSLVGGGVVKYINEFLPRS